MINGQIPPRLPGRPHLEEDTLTPREPYRGFDSLSSCLLWVAFLIVIFVCAVLLAPLLVDFCANHSAPLPTKCLLLSP